MGAPEDAEGGRTPFAARAANALWFIDDENIFPQSLPKECCIPAGKSGNILRAECAGKMYGLLPDPICMFWGHGE